MEVLASNFEFALKNFEENLHGAMYVAVDMEFTGADIDNRPDCYGDAAEDRLSKLCEVAESHAPIQFGITLVKHDENRFQCSSYNFYAFPWVGLELLGQDQSFLCKASALQFNAEKNHIDFNKWLKNAVPYMSREDETRYLASPLSNGDTDLPRKVGLLRVWKLLCEARLPVVTHCPLDIFFLLACFERRNLPRNPREVAGLILQCLPCVFDTAYLHGAIGGFRSLKLMIFLEDARARHSELAASNAALPCSFDLVPETAIRYGAGEIDLAHEAGFDSLCTAQLYAYLMNLAPETVEKSVNRLFLFKSIESLDLRLAADVGEPGSSICDLTHESPMVARLCLPGDSRPLRLISAAGFVYKRMDPSHVLVIIHVREVARAATLESIAGLQWLSFEQWRAEVRSGPCSNQETNQSLHDSRANKIKPKLASGRTDATDSTFHEEEPFNHCGAPRRTPQAWLDGEADMRYCGVVKMFNASNGFGFITCQETFAKFQRDVFVHASQMSGSCIGQKVSFAISTNLRGQPQAKEVIALSWLTGDIDSDDSRTTVGASSDCASISDFDSSYKSTNLYRKQVQFINICLRP